MPICGITTSLCSKDSLKNVPENQKKKLERLQEIKKQLLDLEERKLENSQLVRLLEEEIRKQQIRLSLKPSTNAYLLSRLRNTSYWVASNPELLKAMRVVSQEEPEELVDFETCDDTSSNWSEISDRYVGKMPRRQMEDIHEQDSPDNDTVRTIPSDIVHQLLFSTQDNVEKKQSSSRASLRKRKFVQVSHSRNVTGFFGDFSLYHCTLHTNSGQVVSEEKRYSDFVSLRESLQKSFSFTSDALPEFPQKKVLGKFKEDFIIERQRGLEDFMNSVYLKHSTDINGFIERWLTTCKN